MNKTHKVLDNMNKYTSSDMFGENFLQNLIRFEYLINERFTTTSLEFSAFLNLMPDFIVDTSKNSEFILNLYADCEVVNGEKITKIVPYDDESEISVTFKFSRYGKLLTIILQNENNCLILDSSQDIVVFKNKNKYVKLVNLFKDYFSLNIKRADEENWRNVTSIEKERLDNKIMYSKMLLGI